MGKGRKRSSQALEGQAGRYVPCFGSQRPLQGTHRKKNKTNPPEEQVENEVQSCIEQDKGSSLQQDSPSPLAEGTAIPDQEAEPSTPTSTSSKGGGVCDYNQQYSGSTHPQQLKEQWPLKSSPEHQLPDQSSNYILLHPPTLLHLPPPSPHLLSPCPHLPPSPTHQAVTPHSGPPTIHLTCLICDSKNGNQSSNEPVEGAEQSTRCGKETEGESPGEEQCVCKTKKKEKGEREDGSLAGLPVGKAVLPNPDACGGGW